MKSLIVAKEFHLSRRTTAAVGLSFVLLSSPLAQAQSVCPETIKIGVTSPLTGALALQGQQVKNGVEVAVSEINASGGIAGKKIEIVAEDTTGTVNVATTALHRILRESPVAVFGSMISPENFAQSAIIKTEQVPYLYAGTNSQLSEQKIPWMFRVSYHDGQIAKVLPTYVADKKLKPAFLAVADDFGLGAVKNFRSEFEKISVTPTAVETYSPTDRDMAAQLLKIKDSGATSVVLMGRTPDLILILRSRARLGISLPVLGNTSIGAAPTLANLSPRESDGAIIFGGALPNGSQEPRVTVWQQKMNDKYGYPADNWALAYYDAAYLVKEAIAAVGCDKEQLRKKIAETKDVNGLITKYTADAKGNLSSDLFIYKLEGRVPVLQSVVTPE